MSSSVFKLVLSLAVSLMLVLIWSGVDALAEKTVSSSDDATPTVNTNKAPADPMDFAAFANMNPLDGRILLTNVDPKKNELNTDGTPNTGDSNAGDSATPDATSAVSGDGMATPDGTAALPGGDDSSTNVLSTSETVALGTIGGSSSGRSNIGGGTPSSVTPNTSTPSSTSTSTSTFFNNSRTVTNNSTISPNGLIHDPTRNDNPNSPFKP